MVICLKINYSTFPLHIWTNKSKAMEDSRFLEIVQRMLALDEERVALLKILVAGINPLPPQLPHTDDAEMTRLQVIDYLGICGRTYIRRVNDGTLKPRKMPGGDRFYTRDLKEAHKESIRKGRI